MKNLIHPFHIVEISPWPLLISLSILTRTSSLTILIHFKNFFPLTINIIMIIILAHIWWKDIYRESSSQGKHSKKVIKGLKIGIILFILSETLFFIAFFWAYFHSTLNPNIELGAVWPPAFIEPLSPIKVPLLNTLILLYSGASVTWGHHSIIINKIKNAKISLIVTIILGLWFTIVQAIEYVETSFSIRDSIYGASFFILTGFHGLHVILGTTFLIINFIHLNKKLISKDHHIGFELAAWYWHFVDVVWLFLYFSVYWWGSFNYFISILSTINFQLIRFLIK